VSVCFGWARCHLSTLCFVGEKERKKSLPLFSFLYVLLVFRPVCQVAKEKREREKRKINNSGVTMTIWNSTQKRKGYAFREKKKNITSVKRCAWLINHC